MGKTSDATDRRYPPVTKKIPDYEMSGKPPGHDGNVPEFGIRRDFVYADGKREATESPENCNHSRVKWLFTHKKIEDRQFAAAERLSRDWELSLMQPRASSVIVGNGGGGSGQLPNDAKVAAMRRHGDAMKALDRIRARLIVELVVIQNLSVEKASAQMRVHHRFGSGALNVALHFLADHYKLD